MVFSKKELRNVEYDMLKNQDEWSISTGSVTAQDFDLVLPSFSGHSTRVRTRRCEWLCANWFKVVQTLVFFYIMILLTIDVTDRRARTCASRNEEPRSHLLDYTTEWKRRAEWSGEGDRDNPFLQPPSDEVDKTWEKLLHAKNIRLTPKEVKTLGANTTHKIRVNDGDYVGVLGPYHQLHCLNTIRKIVHWDYYGANLTDAQRQSFIWKKHHLNHCLEVFRQSIMCHAQPTLYLGEWIASSKKIPYLELRPQEQAQCVDWDHLDRWAHGRVLVQGTWKAIPGPFETEIDGPEKPHVDMNLNLG